MEQPIKEQVGEATWESWPIGARMVIADAQATIAALQARVKALEQWVQDQSTANLETMRHTDEMQSRAMEAEQQLTQRTAELEAAKADKAKWEDIAGLRFAGDHKFVKEMELLKVENANLQAELERVRSLIKALPKVEGEIEVSSGVYNFILLKHDSGTRFLCGQIETEQTAKAIAALWQHRQGMEG